MSSLYKRLKVQTAAVSVHQPLVTFFLVFRRFEQFDKLHIDVELHCNEQGDFQQHQLQLLNTCETRERKLGTRK